VSLTVNGDPSLRNYSRLNMTINRRRWTLWNPSYGLL